MASTVDSYLKSVKSWQSETKALRVIILEAGLEEHLKWGKPCYSFEGGNIAIIQPFKACLALMFFKGMLMKDIKKVLVANGPNSQSAKRIEFTGTQDVAKMKSTIKAYLKEAVALEKSGVKVVAKTKSASMPQEMSQLFARNSKSRKAFAKLTPGRQRAYLLHIGAAKLSATRIARLETCIPMILAGKGLMDY